MKQILVFLSLLTSLSAFSQDLTGVGFTAQAGVKGMWGSAESGDNSTVQQRNLTVYGLDALAGLEVMSFFIVGVGASYSVWDQVDDISDVGNTNLSGTMMNYSLAGGVQFLGFRLIGRYILNSEFELDNTNSSGQSVTYQDVESAYSLQFQFPLFPFIYTGFEYMTATYTEQDAGGTVTSLNSNSEVTYSAYGLVVGLAF